MKAYSPEQSAGFFSRLYFQWVQPTLREGMRQPLSVDTLLPLNEAEDPSVCDRDFAKALAAARQARRPVLLAMARLHWPTFAVVFAISILYLAASIGSPLVLRRLIQTLGPQGVPSELPGVAWAAILFGTALATSMTAHHIFHILLKLMIRVRIGLVAAIYRKAMALTIDSRQQAPAGQIINLMGTDAQKFVNVLNVAHSVWVHPLQLILVLGVLYSILGPAALAGALMLCAFLYLSALVAKRHVSARKELARHSDRRVGLMNEILMSIRVIKFYAWETSFEREVEDVRRQEVVELSKLARLSAVGTLIFLSTPVVVAVVTFATFVLAGHTLNAADVFSALALFMVLRQAMVMLPDMVAACLEANVAVARVERFLALPELKSRTASLAPAGTVTMRAADCDWTPGHPALRGVDLHVAPGAFVCVVGAVGAGKSALMAALLDELLVTAGSIDVSGSVAYVSQQAWILNDSIKNNILFGLPFDGERYGRVLKVAHLAEDLWQFPRGDETEIGERGVNLSGGQRQRISLARAVYADAGVLLLDDPLSALDNTVGQAVYDDCLTKTLAGKTRILTTHRLEYVDRADLVVVLEGGQIVEAGKPRELKRRGGVYTALWQSYEHGATQGDTDGTTTDVAMDAPAAVPAVERAAASQLVTDEERFTGVVDRAVYMMYLKTFAPGAILAGLAVVFVLKELLNVGTDSWLAYWSTADAFELVLFLGGFLLLGLLACISTFARSLFISLRGLTAGTDFHGRLLASVLRAPMGFFESTPVGRVLNRFSRDMEAVDLQIPRSLHEAVSCVFSIFSTLLVIVAVTPAAVVAILPIGAIYYWVQRQFRPASREGQRLDSITRSPIFAQFSESLAGVQILRAYGAVPRFEQELLHHLETNSRTFYTIVSCNRWLGTRIESLGALIVATAAFMALRLQSSEAIGFAGLAVTYSLAITGAMNWAVRMFSQLESNLNSVERIDHYARLTSERWDGAALPPQWPTRGHIEFHDVELRYRPELPPVIKGLTCTIHAGEKLGIVGRTGAGKSSLLLGLFRVLEASDGRIAIDGVDIASLELASLRGALAIIPQEPVLFSGTVRKNLDPFATHGDTALWDALERAQLKPFVTSLAGGLDAVVHEGGSNFSVGQRQLLCLARAILRRSSVLLLDEATASVDVATDTLIRQTIRREFAAATVITIAHRLGTVMDCDRIMVLDAGRVAELDAPKALLGNRRGAFHKMVREESLSMSV
jgi:ATP-binding cassette subfamily C (CFTR/MRP) protein 1